MKMAIASSEALAEPSGFQCRRGVSPRFDEAGRLVYVVAHTEPRGSAKTSNIVLTDGDDRAWLYGDGCRDRQLRERGWVLPRIRALAVPVRAVEIAE